MDIKLALANMAPKVKSVGTIVAQGALQGAVIAVTTIAVTAVIAAIAKDEESVNSEE